MPRKKRGLPARRIASATPKNDSLLLDEFSHQDLIKWQRNSALLHEYRVRQFYELESLRELHRADLIGALENVPIKNQSVSGWSRIVDYRYSLEPLSVKGSLVHGGRFNVGKNLGRNRFSSFPCLYVAEDYNTAYAERFGLPLAKGPGLKPHELSLQSSKSFTNVNLRGEIHGLFDLRDQKYLKQFAKVLSKFKTTNEQRELARKLGLSGPLLLTSPKDLFKSFLGSWTDMPSQYGLPANSQIFARFLKEAGFEGVLYRSTKSTGLCVALFPDSLGGSDSYVELADRAPPEVKTKRLDHSTADFPY